MDDDDALSDWNLREYAGFKKALSVLRIIRADKKYSNLSSALDVNTSATDQRNK